MPKRAPPLPDEVTALSLGLEGESLQALYAAWAELRLKRAGLAAQLDRERATLRNRAEYLVNAIGAARNQGPRPAGGRRPNRSDGVHGLVPSASAGDPLARFQSDAEAEAQRAGGLLESRAQRDARAYQDLEARIRKLIRARAERHLARHRPRLRLRVHPVGKDRVLIQCDCPGDEDAVLLCWLLHQRLPTRWGFFSDDSIDDMARGPARLYADEGVTEVWSASPEALDAVLHGRGTFVPVRLQIPLRLPRKAFPRFRLVHHGPVAEVESRHARQPYDHLLPRADGERLTGHLLRLKLAQALDLEVSVG